MSTATTDLSDAHGSLVRHCAPVFRDFGGRIAFSGQIVTLKAFEDNTKVRELLEMSGEGRVLVIDGGGSLNCAMVGGNLGVLAEQNGWTGILVNGCVRDTAELNDCDVGIKALAAHPRKTEKRGLGDAGVFVSFAGVTFAPGDWLYADADGVIVSSTKLD
ncbi:MAG: ribonuclease E activity regulator RraA [Parvibaculaceae bacterium]|nr:ribonuclease E activity regulator RraA [Parvibaculaceae bacterium]